MAGLNPFPIEAEFIKIWELEDTLFAGIWYEPAIKQARLSMVKEGLPPHLRRFTDMLGTHVEKGYYFAMAEPREAEFAKFMAHHMNYLLEGNIGISGNEVATHVILVRGHFGVIIAELTFKTLLKETLSGADTTEELKTIFTPRRSQ